MYFCTYVHFSHSSFAIVTYTQGSGVVIQARPRRGIPQAELDKLQQLRERLSQVKVSSKDSSVDDVKEEEDDKVVVSKLQMIDVAANLTNFR